MTKAAKASKANETTETENTPTAETKATKAAKKDCLVRVSRDNFSTVCPGVFKYDHAGKVEECEDERAFQCVQAKNYGVRTGDIVICKDGEKAILVVVK